MSGTDPLSPLPFGADGGAPKLAGRRRHHGLGVGRGAEMMAGEDAMTATAMTGEGAVTGEGGRRRRRHSRRAGQTAPATAGRRRKHSRRAGEDAAATGGRRHRRSHSARGGLDAGRRRSRRGPAIASQRASRAAEYRSA